MRNERMQISSRLTAQPKFLLLKQLIGEAVKKMLVTTFEAQKADDFLPYFLPPSLNSNARNLSYD